MSFEKSEIMREFFKLAEESDMLGIKKTAAPEKNPHQEDLKTIEEKRLKSPEKSIIEEAHPEPVYVAEARGDGGLVENQIEQQKKLLEMINKMPTGSLVGRYAGTVLGLKKMAEDLDEVKQLDESDVIMRLAVEFIRLAEDFDPDLDDPFLFDPDVESMSDMDPLQRNVYRAQQNGLKVCDVCGEEDCEKSEEECAEIHGYDTSALDPYDKGEQCKECAGTGKKGGEVPFQKAPKND